MKERRARRVWPWWSTTRWAVALFTLAEVWRLAGSPFGTANWAEAFLAFCILFALPIDGALSKAPAVKVVEAVTGIFGKPAEGATWVADTVVGARAVDDPDIPRGTAEVS